MYRKYIKRALGVILSVAAIVILSPLFVILSISVLVGMGRPILFSQKRIGKDEEIFTIYKFRSMTDDRDENGTLLPESDRLTKFGMVLRSSSLDELPELFSILKGDMSFVGPRPLPVYYGPYFLPEERARHSVRGGLIPPDSLEGTPVVDWETQFKDEVYYANNVSFSLDIKIVMSTFAILIKRMKTNYGADDRPHLNKYREGMKIPDEVNEAWAMKQSGAEAR